MIQRSGKTLVPALAALALVFGGTMAIAQQSSSSANSTQHSTKAATRTMNDAEFAQRAAEANLAEVKLGNLAEQKGTTETVKDFGKRMVADHSKAEDTLKTVAATNQITLPTALDAKGPGYLRSTFEIVRRGLDRTYARDMLRDHRNDVAEFRDEASDGKDAAIKNFASRTLPTLETHLKLAHEMVQTVSAQKTSETSRHSG